MASSLLRGTASVAVKFLTVQARQIHTSQLSRGPWKIGKLNHVAIVCPDLDKATYLYKDVLRAKVSEKQDLECHGVTVVSVDLGETKIELLQPLGDKSPIQNFLNENACGGMHHIGLEVNDIAAAVQELKCKKIRIIGEKPTIGTHGKPVIFLHPKDFCGVLVKLEEFC